MQFGKQDAARQAAYQGKRQKDERLPDQDTRKVALVHAENVVKAEFLFAPADQKRVGVKKDQQCEHTKHDRAELQDELDLVTAAHIAERTAFGQERNDIEHGDRADTGQNVRDVELFVFADAVPGKPQVKRALHKTSPPVASIVSVSEIF